MGRFPEFSLSTIHVVGMRIVHKIKLFVKFLASNRLHIFSWQISQTFYLFTNINIYHVCLESFVSKTIKKCVKQIIKILQNRTFLGWDIFVGVVSKRCRHKVVKNLLKSVRYNKYVVFGIFKIILFRCDFNPGKSREVCRSKFGTIGRLDQCRDNATE